MQKLLLGIQVYVVLAFSQMGYGRKYPNGHSGGE